jgi:hypothetical protein
MPAAVRYIGMFRTAAVIFVFFGALWIWRFAFTDYHPEQRPFGLALGGLALVVGVFLFRRARAAIGISVVASASLCLLATLAIPSIQGPPILLFAGIAILAGVYSALALRALFSRGSDTAPGA